MIARDEGEAVVARREDTGLDKNELERIYMSNKLDKAFKNVQYISNINHIR